MSSRVTDPPRLRTSIGSSDLLIEALEEAHVEFPDTDQVQRLARDLGPLLGAATVGTVLGAGAAARAGVAAVKAGASHSVPPLAAAVAATTFKFPILALLTGMGLGAAAWQFAITRPPASTHAQGPAISVVAPNHAPVAPGPAAPAAPARPELADPAMAPPPAMQQNGARAADDGAPATFDGKHAPAAAVDGRGGRDGRSTPALPPAAGGLEATNGGAFAPSTGAAAETEMSILGRAQQALATDPSTALDLAEQHARRYPNGVLTQEREFIAIQALVRLGRQQEAAARGARFRAQFPGSAHLRRLDILLGKGSNAAENGG